MYPHVSSPVVDTEAVPPRVVEMQLAELAAANAQRSQQEERDAANAALARDLSERTGTAMPGMRLEGVPLRLLPSPLASRALRVRTRLLWHIAIDVGACGLIASAHGARLLAGFVSPAVGVVAARALSWRLAVLHVLVALINATVRTAYLPTLTDNFLDACVSVALAFPSLYLAWLSSSWAQMLYGESHPLIDELSSLLGRGKQRTLQPGVPLRVQAHTVPPPAAEAAAQGRLSAVVTGVPVSSQSLDLAAGGGWREPTQQQQGAGQRRRALR